MPRDLDDKAFDNLLPPYTRKRSGQFWTPVAVARRAAEMLNAHRARKILDVGCGPGKFCIAAGLSQPDLYSAHRFGSELLRVESLLSRARMGTVVTTYHGLGGPIPASYELVAEARAGSDRVRAWVQGRPRVAKWVWIETVSDVIRIPQVDARSALASLLCGEGVPD